MNRKAFIKGLSLSTIAMSLNTLKTIAQSLSETDVMMPVLFIGHGNPMNAIEENEFTKGWKEIAKTIPKPKVILFISAHWLTKGSYISSVVHPETIHDFGGFPQELFDVQYPAPGSPEIAKNITTLVTEPIIQLDQSWGLDHGAWSVAKPMYPNADIPTLQLSIDYYQPGQYHYDLAKQLLNLRKKGVLIIGSGNMIHHLGLVNFQKKGGEDWAIELNELFKDKINNGDHTSLINYEKLHAHIKLAVPTPDHYFPLIYTLALQQKNEEVKIFNDQTIHGSLSMTSVKIG
jgi:4,5-DOPA dioxygenase extradiol